ncbi:MAG: C39 family peptidase [Kosmotogaceae bacterium]
MKKFNKIIIAFLTLFFLACCSPEALNINSFDLYVDEELTETIFPHNSQLYSSIEMTPTSTTFVDDTDQVFPTTTKTPESATTSSLSTNKSVTYCRDNLAILKHLYPDFKIPEGADCVFAPAPPNSVINKVPYYNQANFPNLTEDYQPCTPGFDICKYSPPGTGCGPTAFYMAINYVLPENNIYYYDLWDSLNSSNTIKGTSKECVQRLAADIGIMGRSEFNMNWEEITDAIDSKSVILLRIYRPGQPIFDDNANQIGWEYTGEPPFPPYEFERYCGPDLCYPGGHWVLIVGYSLGDDIEDPSDDLLVLHDSFTKRMGDSSEQDKAALNFGNYLLIKRSTLEERIYLSESNWAVEIIVPKDEINNEIKGLSFDIPKNICDPDDEICVLDVSADRQDYILSCEASVSGMAASYFCPKPPEDFISWENYFIEHIPTNCNPHQGFRGSIDGVVSISCDPGYGYGVYAEPVADAFNDAGIPATVVYNMTYEDVIEELRNNHLVIVWVSPYEQEPVCDDKACYIYGEHVWLVTGVKGNPNDYYFRVNDPKFGRQFWVSSFPRWEDFKSDEGVGFMSVVIGK